MFMYIITSLIVIFCLLRNFRSSLSSLFSFSARLFCHLNIHSKGIHTWDKWNISLSGYYAITFCELPFSKPIKQTAEHPTFCYWSPHMKKDKEKEGKTSNRADRPFRRHANVYFAKYMNIVGTRTSLMGVQILQNTQQSLASTII